MEFYYLFLNIFHSLHFKYLKYNNLPILNYVTQAGIPAQLGRIGQVYLPNTYGKVKFALAYGYLGYYNISNMRHSGPS